MDNFICKKVTSLLSSYIENKLDSADKLFVENHFLVCESCYKKYLEMKEVMSNLHLEYAKMMDEFEKIESNKMFNIREYETFYKNISPYIDDELCYNDSIKFRRYLLKSKSARAELAGAYNLKNNIKHSVASFKDNINMNFSKKIIKKLQNENKDSYEKIYRKAAVLIGVMVSVLLLISVLAGFSYFSKSFAQTNSEINVIQIPNNDDEMVEFYFDENNEAILTAK